MDNEVIQREIAATLDQINKSLSTLTWVAIVVGLAVLLACIRYLK